MEGSEQFVANRAGRGMEAGVREGESGEQLLQFSPIRSSKETSAIFGALPVPLERLRELSRESEKG